MSWYPPSQGIPQPPFHSQGPNSAYPAQYQSHPYQHQPQMSGPYSGQGYGQSQYPPQGQSPFPPHQGYGQPPPNQGYGGPPPQGYPGYGPPPPGPPPGQQFGGQPQFGGQSGPYGNQQQPYGQQGYGAPQGGQFQSGPPAPPSMGYVPGQTAPVDMSHQADALRNAMKGMGTNEKTLIAVLALLDPLQIASLQQAYQMRHNRSLINDIDKETSSWFGEGLLAIVRGPLDQDVHNIHRAIQGLGTKETLLNDVLLSRSNADMNAIKAHYQRTHRRSLEADVRGDLSAKTERLFDMVLSARRAEESSPIIQQAIDADVTELYRATEGTKMGTDQVTVCSILVYRSDGQIRAISQAYQQKYRRALSDVLKKEFSSHMEAALLFILSAAEDRAKHDATLMEDSMKGMGTKDDLLVNRVVRVHWNRERLSQCKAAYRHFHRKDLSDRIKGETRGDYEKLMVAVVESA